MLKTETTTTPTRMLLPQWMYRQIIHDPSVKAVWCFCKRPALTYCNGLQFVCHGGGHFGVPMKALKPRPEEQAFVERQCSIARELERAKHESGKPCKRFNLYPDAPGTFCRCGFHLDEHTQRKGRKKAS